MDMYDELRRATSDHLRLAIALGCLIGTVGTTTTIIDISVMGAINPAGSPFSPSEVLTL